MADLSPREVLIVRNIYRGLTYKEVALELHSSESRIKEACKRLRQKIGANNRSHVVRWWAETGKQLYPAETPKF